MTYDRDQIHDILLHPERHTWQIQGFGMLRTYLDGPNEPRLQVWDQRLATWSNNAIHDHPWAFTSTIFAGLLYNQRYGISDCTRWPHSELWEANGHVTEIVPGTRGGKLTERPVRPCLIHVAPVEVYAMGDSYSQTHREMHLTRYAQGTVTLIERTEREADDIARVAWYGDAASQPPFVNPHEASTGQIERTICLALNTWFLS